MPRFAANLSPLFAEHPFLDRFAYAAQAGFQFVEFQFPCAWPVADIRARMDGAGVQAVLHNLLVGDWARGDRGIACDPARVAEFRMIACARDLGVPRLNLLAGCAPSDLDPALLHTTFIDHLRFAAQALAADGLTLLIEPINTPTILAGTNQALARSSWRPRSICWTGWAMPALWARNTCLQRAQNPGWSAGGLGGDFFTQR